VRDTVVVPAQREGFHKAFISANAWWAIGIAEKHRVNLRWIVLGASGIRDHASSRLITSNPTVTRGKFKVCSKVPLRHSVRLGDLSGNHLSAGDPLASVGFIHKSTSYITFLICLFVGKNVKIMYGIVKRRHPCAQ
jgi:hypothetical protein